MTRIRDWDTSALIAACIGLLALLVSGYTAYLQRQQVRAQVWPRVDLMRNPARLAFTASNRGLGPARMIAARVTIDGKAVKGWGEVLRVFGYEGPWSQGHFSTRVFSPGQEIDFIKLQGGGEAAERVYNQLLGQNEHKLGILGCYCSVLDQCWEISMGRIHDRAVDVNREVGSCRIRDDERFEE